MKRLALALLLCLTMSGCAHSQSKPETDSTRPKHHLPDGTFRNNYLPSINKPFADLFKWWWTGEKPEPIRFPLSKNDPAFLQQNRTEPTLTWIGHATLLIQFDGLNILTDPHPRTSHDGILGLPKERTCRTALRHEVAVSPHVTGGRADIEPVPVELERLNPLALLHQMADEIRSWVAT